jgi:hypothetical protein
VDQGAEWESLGRTGHHNLHPEEIELLIDQLHRCRPGETLEGRREGPGEERIRGIVQAQVIQEADSGETVLG